MSTSIDDLIYGPVQQDAPVKERDDADADADYDIVHAEMVKLLKKTYYRTQYGIRRRWK